MGEIPPRLTLLIAQRLLQHGQDDGVVQDEVAEVAGPGGAEAGVADQGVLVQQAAGGGRPAGRWEGSQHLHDAGGRHGNTQRYPGHRRRGGRGSVSRADAWDGSVVVVVAAAIVAVVLVAIAIVALVAVAVAVVEDYDEEATVTQLMLELQAGTDQERVASAASFTLMEAGLCSLSPLWRTSRSCRDLLPEMPSSTISSTSTRQSCSTGDNAGVSPGHAPLQGLPGG